MIPPNPAKGRFNSFSVTYQDAATRSYEAEIRYIGQREMAGREPFTGMLRCRVTAVFTMPKSMSKKDRERAFAGYLMPTVKPDDDNLLKCRDALKGVVFRDDSLFIESVVRKFYGDVPCWQFECWRFTGGAML